RLAIRHHQSLHHYRDARLRRCSRLASRAGDRHSDQPDTPLDPCLRPVSCMLRCAGVSFHLALQPALSRASLRRLPAEASNIAECTHTLSQSAVEDDPADVAPAAAAAVETPGSVLPGSSYPDLYARGSCSQPTKWRSFSVTTLLQNCARGISLRFLKTTVTF